MLIYGGGTTTIGNFLTNNKGDHNTNILTIIRGCHYYKYALYKGVLVSPYFKMQKIRP